MKPSHYRHRADTTAKALTAEAKRLGVECETLGAGIDAVLWLGPIVRLVDWKSPGGELTPGQAKLVARGCPIAFISNVAQLEALVASMRRDALAKG